MKHLLYILILSLNLTAFSQWSDCSNSIPACSNPSFSVTPNGSGNDEDFTINSTVSNPQTNVNATPGNAGCLQSGELNSTWIVISVSQGGDLEFSMGTANTFNCFDWAMWPYDANTCSGIQGNTLAPVSCNWNGACTGITGMADPANLPTDADQSDFEYPISVNAGDQFIVCFSNFSSASTNVPLDFFGSAQVTCGSVSSPTICYGETGEIIAFDGVSWAWDTSTPGFISANATGETATINPTVTTDYTVTITYSDGSTTSATGTVTVLPQITASISETPETCSGTADGAISISLTNGTAPITYDLSGPSSATNTTGTFNNLVAGTYTIDITDADGCSIQETATINTGPACCAMTLTVTTTDTDCFGSCTGTATVDTTGTTGPCSIQWYDGTGTAIAGATGLSTSGLCAETYTVEVTDPACIISETGTVGAPAQITASTSVTQETCLGFDDGAISISTTNGTTPITYNLSGGTSATNTTGTFNNLPSGSYTIDIIDADGCSIQETTNIGSGPACCFTTLNITSIDIDCFGNCNGSLTVDTSGTTGTSTIQWYDGSGNAIAGANSLSINNLCAGTYTVEVTDALCTVSQTETIVEPTTLLLSTSPTDLSCNSNNSGQIVLTGSGGVSPYQYSIDNGIGMQANGTFSNLPAGPYNLLVEDANGCQATGSNVLLEPTVLSASVSVVNNTCNSANAPCDGAITSSVQGGTPPYNYSWSNSATTSDINVVCAGVYSLMVTDENGCSETINGIAVTEPTAVQISNVSYSHPLCHDDCNGSISIQSNAMTYSIDNGVTSQASSDFTDLCSGIYSIVVTDGNGCSTSTSTTLFNPDLIYSDFDASPDSATVSNPLFELIPGETNGTNHFWYYIDESDTIYVYDEQPILTLPGDGPGIYETCIVAYNNNLCYDTTCHILTVGDEFYIFVPNSFSPNNDGVNDVFYPVVSNYNVNDFEFLVFNRWGQIVFKSESPDVGWNGLHISSPAEVGVYIWKIKTESEFDGVKKVVSGHVNLFR